MANDKRLDCTKCSNHLTFGGASRGMVKAMGGMKAVMEMMAENAGWTKTPAGWVCGYTQDHNEAAPNG